MHSNSRLMVKVKPNRSRLRFQPKRSVLCNTAKIKVSSVTSGVTVGGSSPPKNEIAGDRVIGGFRGGEMGDVEHNHFSGFLFRNLQAQLLDFFAQLPQAQA